ncbi:Down syndrome cell adhesion molecule [Nymphon striatum]|nr:Down syndrome cell adhesion molecule [Nymphon striatum]
MFSISWCYQRHKEFACEEITNGAITNSAERTIVGNSLIIRASMKDTGFYMSFIHPQRQIVDIGQAINISCVISGGPFTFLKWFKDGRFLKEDRKLLNVSKSTISVSNVVKTTEGMYQCFVGNIMDEKQAIGQIILSAVPPTIVKVFKTQHRRPGQSVTLECAATGDPLPQIQWTLRDSLIKKSFGINIENKVEAGKSWSKLTINTLQILNGGIYQCIAINKVGKDIYSNTIHVYGPPRVWPLLNETVVAGKSFFMQCHVSGYPVTSITWKKENERIKMYNNGTLKITSAIGDVDNVAPILKDTHNETLRFGRRLHLSCVLTAGDPPIEFIWLYNGQVLPHDLGLIVSDSTYSSFLNHQNVGRNHMGNYSCIARNSAGSSSKSSFVKVQAPPEWQVKPNQSKLEVNIGEYVSKKLERLVDLPTKRIVHQNGTLSLFNISEEDLQITYRCQISNGIPPSLVANMQLMLKSDDGKTRTHKNKDFINPLMSSVATPVDFSSLNKNVKKLENSIMMGKNLDEDDKRFL